MSHVAARALASCLDRGIHVEGDPSSVASWRVYCSTPALAGSLLFLPLIPSPHSLGTDTVHPHRVQCATLGNGKALYIVPYVRGMAKAATLAAKTSAWITPFWVIRRSQDESECNCALAEIDSNTITTIGAGGPMLKVSSPRLVTDNQLRLPVITNTRDVAADTELVIHFAKPKAKAKPAPTKAPAPRKRARPSETGQAPSAPAEGDAKQGGQQLQGSV